MKARHLFALLCLASPNVLAQSRACDEWESSIKAEISAANGCDSRHQACLAMGPGNPMRELNYCQNLLRRCESFDGPVEGEELNRQLEQYKKQCP